MSDSIAIAITDFRSETIMSKTLKKIQNINQQQHPTFIIDLRNNRGGSIYEAIKFGALFVTKNNLIQLQKQDNKPVIVTRPNDHPYVHSKQLIILINDQTASAAEAVCYILKHHPNHIIIGKKTHGKKAISSKTNRQSPYKQLLIPTITPNIVVDWNQTTDTERIYLKALALSNHKEN